MRYLLTSPDGKKYAVTPPDATSSETSQASRASLESQPFREARKAPDGHWYVPDTSRPGKYLRVTRADSGKQYAANFDPSRQSENIEDRRGEEAPYARMLATNRMVNRATGGLTVGFDKKLPRVAPSRLTKDIGLEDIQRNTKDNAP